MPLKFQSYAFDDPTYINTGSVEIANDENNLYIQIHVGFGFQPIENNIDIGLYKSIPPSTPDPSTLHYHFTSTDF